MKKVSLILGCSLLILLAGCGKTDYEKLEKELTTKASQYYEDNLKDKVLGVTNHKVTLSALKQSNVSIKDFTDAKCDDDSYALINLKLNDKKEVTSYTVENHLTCGSYKTETK